MVSSGALRFDIDRLLLHLAECQGQTVFARLSDAPGHHEVDRGGRANDREGLRNRHIQRLSGGQAAIQRLPLRPDDGEEHDWQSK